MDGLFTDPNCSSLVPWSSWLAQLGGLDLGAYGAEPTAEGLKAQQAEELMQGRMEVVFGPC